MKKRHITLLTAFAAAAAFASTAQADLTTGMSSVLRSENSGAYTTDGMGTSIGNLDYALGNFDVTDTAAERNTNTSYRLQWPFRTNFIISRNGRAGRLTFFWWPIRKLGTLDVASVI